MGPSLTHIMSHIWESETSKIFEISEMGIYIYIYIVFYINLRRWGSTIDKFSIKSISKSLDMNFISIQNMKWKFGNMHKISFENIKHFLKPRNQKNKKPFLFSSKGAPSTFWCPPLHPTIFLGDTMNSKQRRSSESMYVDG